MSNPYESEAFNDDMVVTKEVTRIIQHFKPKYIIETGTHEARTSKYLASLGIEFHTIEINKEYYEDCKQKLQHFDNATVHLGASDEVLNSLLPKLKLNDNEYIFFYLDAHWGANFPLKNELNIIGHYCCNKSLICIDDFQVPNRNFQHDRYDNEILGDNMIKYSKRHLNDQNHPYISYYNDASLRNGVTVGKIYIIPQDSTTSTWIKPETNYYSNLQIS